MNGTHRSPARRRPAAWLVVSGYLLALLAGASLGLALPASPSGLAPVTAIASPTRTVINPAPARVQVRTTRYTVRPGDTLTAIARRFHRPSYRTVWAINRFEVPDPDLIRPGQVLLIGVTSR